MNKLLNRIKLAKMLLNLSTVESDKGELILEGELAKGKQLFSEVNGDINVVEDGEYTIDNNKVTVSNGEVEEIVSLEAEEPTTVEENLEEVAAPAESVEPVTDEAPVAEPEAPVAEEPVAEVLPEPVANPELDELRANLADKDKLIAELKSKIEAQDKLLQESTAESAHEVAKRNAQAQANGFLKNYLK